MFSENKLANLWEKKLKHSVKLKWYMYKKKRHTFSKKKTWKTVFLSRNHINLQTPSAVCYTCSGWPNTTLILEIPEFFPWILPPSLGSVFNFILTYDGPNTWSYITDWLMKMLMFALHTCTANNVLNPVRFWLICLMSVDNRNNCRANG